MTLTLAAHRAQWTDDSGWSVRVTGTDYYESDSGRLHKRPMRAGKRAWNIRIVNVFGDVIHASKRDRSDTIRGWNGSREALSAALSFLASDAERYQPDGTRDGDPYSYGPDVAEWAADHEDEITLAQCEIDETEDGR